MIEKFYKIKSINDTGNKVVVEFDFISAEFVESEVVNKITNEIEIETNMTNQIVLLSISGSFNESPVSDEIINNDIKELLSRFRVDIPIRQGYEYE